MALFAMSTANLMSACISREVILRRAGLRYFQRGMNYFRQGRVVEMEDLGNGVEAIVEGTEEYVVRLEAASGALEHTCNCPLGLDGAFCKHCVAVALAWMEGRAADAGVQEAVSAAQRKSAKSRITGEDIAAALNAADRATLVRLVLEWAEGNAPLKAKLMELGALRKGPEAGIALARKTLEKSIRIRNHLDYRETPSYAAGVEAAIDAVDALLGNGQAASVIDLCEDGMQWLSTAIEQVDDSDGYVMTLIERLQDLHLRACMEAKPDPVSLARKLFHSEMNSCFGEWNHAAEKYAELLGQAGLAAYRSLAQTAWARVPARTHGSGDDNKQNHFAITRIMEGMARQSGAIEDLVAVLERDLSHAHQYLRIAEIYRQANAREKALEWAERGMTAMPGFDGAGLRQFVAEEYRHSDRHADALRIIWIDFRDNPSLHSYQRLEEFARAAEDWEEWRSQALAHLRRSFSINSGKPGNVGASIHGWRYAKRDYSLLVEVFLHEGQEADAWAEAQAGGCSDTLWLRLAELREKQQPADAKAIYVRLGEQSVLRASGNYDDGVALLERAAAQAHALGKSAEFEAELDLFLRKHKAKRNLQKRAAERRRFLYLHEAIR